MRIPQDKIDQVREATDIIDLISAYVNLRKRGKNYVGLCPFHSEKTPSFTASAEKQVYHCFGCGVGGNVFTFVMEHEKVSFVEAVRFLADRVGITLPSPSPEAEARASEAEILYNVMRLSARFFHDSLTGSSEGEFALGHFRERGFADETIRKFGLGYSPKGWDGLVEFARKEGVDLSYLEKVGLARRREDGSYYDYFRGRAMFPIFSTSGRVIGFGARKLYDDDPMGKYINSPETPIYVKSRVLYGIFQAKNAIIDQDSAILVEGYADLISVFQAGIQNVVASSGTALTPEQIQLVGRYTKNTTLVYDADSAGSTAMMRGVDLVVEGGLDVKVAELPQGHDPDSFVRNFGGEEFQTLLQRAVSFIDFKARTFQREGKFDTPEGQAEAVRSIVQTIARMADELKQNFYIKQVAERYGIYESILYRELEKWRPREKARRVSAETSAQQVPVYDTPLSEVTPRRALPISAAERDLLKLILEQDGGLIGKIFEHVTLEDFTDPRVKALVSAIFHHHKEGTPIDFNALINQAEGADVKSLITDLMVSEYEMAKSWSRQGVEVKEPTAVELTNSALVVLKERSLERKIEENQRKLKEAQARGLDTAPFTELHMRLRQELKEIKGVQFISSTGR
jgi:DNA primase